MKSLILMNQTMNNYWRDLRKEPRFFSKRQMGGGSVMVWAAFCVKSKSEIAFINGQLNSEGYQTMLENFLIPMMENWPENDFVFQQTMWQSMFQTLRNNGLPTIISLFWPGQPEIRT